jgi:hypothetical protein
VGLFEEHGGDFGVLLGEDRLGLGFSVAKVSSVAAVSLAITGDPMGIKRDPQWMIW